jgi:peptidyl-prolyl cis-trans isomerase D
MLSGIRALARSPIFGGFIIALLIAAFALFGVSDIFRGGGTAAVIVGKEQVGVQDLSRAFERQVMAIQRENPRLTREQADELGLGEQMVQMLTAQAAIEAKARDLNLAVSDQQITDAIADIDAFRNPFNNRFDQATYLSVLQQNGYGGSRAGQVFEAELRDDLLRTQLLSAILGGVETPDIIATARRAYQQERRAITGLLLPASLIGELEAPDDETLRSFIAENAQTFRQPEQRRFTLVRFNPDDFTRDVDVPEEDLRDLYDFKLENGELAEPPTRSITQWVAEDEAAANAGVGALQLGMTPAEADLGESVTLENVEAFEIPDTSISDAAFERGEGDVFAVQGRLGWRIVRVDAASDPEVPSFASLRPSLIEELSAGEAFELMSDSLSRFEDARAQGLTFEAAGAQANVPVESFDFLTARGTTVEGIPAATLRNAPEILSTVFETPVGFETDADRYGENSYFMIRVNEIVEERVPELDEIREFAEAVWRARETDNRLQTLVDQALARAEAGESLNQIADTIEGAVVEAAILSRSETSGPFSQQVVGGAFAQAESTPFEARASDPSTRMVAVVTDVIVPQSAAIDPAQQAQLATELESDLTVALEAALFASYEVRRDQALIDLALGRVDPNQIP